MFEDVFVSVTVAPEGIAAALNEHLAKDYHEVDRLVHNAQYTILFRREFTDDECVQLGVPTPAQRRAEEARSPWEGLHRG